MENNVVELPLKKRFLKQDDDYFLWDYELHNGIWIHGPQYFTQEQAADHFESKGIRYRKSLLHNIKASFTPDEVHKNENTSLDDKE